MPDFHGSSTASIGVSSLGLLSEKRRLSEVVYLETDKDGDDAMIHGRSSEGVEWELDIDSVVSELAESENRGNPPREKKA